MIPMFVEVVVSPNQSRTLSFYSTWVLSYVRIYNSWNREV